MKQHVAATMLHAPQWITNNEALYFSLNLDWNETGKAHSLSIFTIILYWVYFHLAHATQLVYHPSSDYVRWLNIIHSFDNKTRAYNGTTFITGTICAISIIILAVIYHPHDHPAPFVCGRWFHRHCWHIITCFSYDPCMIHEWSCAWFWICRSAPLHRYLKNMQIIRTIAGRFSCSGSRLPIIDFFNGADVDAEPFERSNIITSNFSATWFPMGF